MPRPPSRVVPRHPTDHPVPPRRAAPEPDLPGRPAGADGRRRGPAAGAAAGAARPSPAPGRRRGPLDRDDRAGRDRRRARPPDDRGRGAAVLGGWLGGRLRSGLRDPERPLHSRIRTPEPPMPLAEYRRKRDFKKTPEPSGGRRPRRGRDLSFVIQKHDASRLHYDFRLEMEGVLRSWAVPKGPSLKPSEKRLAVHVEDHPISYGDFEGVIPEGQYGGGTVLLWDRGVWHPEGDPVEGYRKGKLKFRLEGEKLNGGWTLVRMGGPRSEGGKNWLLIKERDETALRNGRKDVTEARPESVDTGRSLEQIARERDRVWGSSGKGGGRAAGRKRSSLGRPKRARSAARLPHRPDAARVPGARRGALPA